MRYFKIILLIALLAMISCGDDNPVDDDNNQLEPVNFIPVESGFTWHLVNDGGEEAEINIYPKQKTIWMDAWWLEDDTSEIVCYPMEMEIFKGTFPELHDFGIIVKESSIIVGMKRHPLGSGTKIDIYAPLFEIRNDLQDTVVTKQAELDFFGKKYTVEESSTIVFFDGDVKFNQPVRAGINYTAKRTGHEDKQAIMQFEFEDGRGPSYFWGYQLTAISKP
jgi:hypothetical protein